MSVVSQSLPPSYQEAQMMTQTCVTISKNETPPQNTESTILSGSQTITTAEIQDDPAIESDKTLIYKHPLFPLLALLFEKCEQATQTSDCPSSESFDVDIQAFLQHQEKSRKSFLLDDRDLDNLMVKALEVLRIHLLELEKVNDLCKDFCTRYISCLKGKLQSENLLKVEYDGPPSPGSPTGQSGVVSQVLPGVVNSVPGGNVLVPQGVGQNSVSMASWNQGQIVSGGTVYQMVQTPQGLVAQPIQIQTAPIQTQVAAQSVIQGNTPLSQIGLTNVSSTPQTTASATNPVSSAIHHQLDSDDEDGNDKKKNKRGVLPKYATQIMKSWLFQHIVHPYPTEDEKRQIAQQTNLTLLQVNNWFINARRRILQPMLDSSNPETPKVKKTKPQTRPSTRFWPESIANIQPQIPSTGQSQAVIDNTTTVTNSQPSSIPVTHPVTHAVTHAVSQPLIVPTFMTPDGQVLTIANPMSVISQQQLPTELREQQESQHYESQLQNQIHIKHEEAVDDSEHHKDILNTSVSEDNISADNDSDSSL